MEGDEIIDLPDYLLIDGTHYSQLKIKGGIYPIDYTDGPFGSVFLKSELLP